MKEPMAVVVLGPGLVLGLSWVSWAQAGAAGGAGGGTGGGTGMSSGGSTGTGSGSNAGSTGTGTANHRTGGPNSDISDTGGRSNNH
jgi:hypothetical protein